LSAAPDSNLLGAPPTQSATISVTLKKGIYEYLCTAPGHANAGMKGALIVTG